MTKTAQLVLKNDAVIDCIVRVLKGEVDSMVHGQRHPKNDATITGLELL